MSEKHDEATNQPLVPLQTEALVAPEKKYSPSKFRRTLGKLALAAALIIPPADLAISDVTTAKVYETIQDHTVTESPLAQKGIELGETGAFITGVSFALGQAISRNKKVHNAYDDFEAYSAERRANRGPAKRAASWLITRPLWALEKLGNAAERAGSYLEQRKSKVAQVAGRIAIDTGQVNSIGTSAVIMNETMAGNTPSIKRQVYLGGLIAGSWLGAAERVRQLYRHAPDAVQTGMADFGQTFNALTDITTPTGALAIGTVAAGFGYVGWQIEAFRQRRQEDLGVDHSQVQEAITTFNHSHQETT